MTDTRIYDLLENLEAQLQSIERVVQAIHEAVRPNLDEIIRMYAGERSPATKKKRDAGPDLQRRGEAAATGRAEIRGAWPANEKGSSEIGGTF